MENIFYNVKIAENRRYKLEAFLTNPHYYLLRKIKTCNYIGKEYRFSEWFKNFVFGRIL